MTTKEKILRAQNIIVIALFIIVAVILKLVGNFEDVKLRDSYEINTLNEWSITYSDGTIQEVTGPCMVNDVSGETVILETVLPDDIKPGEGIMLLSGYSEMELYIEGERVAEFAVQPHVPFGRMVGNIRVLAKLTPEDSGKTLTVKSTPKYTANMDFKGAEYGELSALKFDLLYRNMWRIVLASTLFVMSLLSVGLSLFRFAKRENVNNWIFYHLGFFILEVQIWIICSSDLPQVIADATDIASFVSFICLAIMPIHYAAFCVEIIPQSRSTFSVVQIIGWFIPFFEIVGYVFNIADPVDTFGPFSLLRMNHIYIAVVAFYSFWKSFEHRNDSRLVSIFAVANSVLVISVSIAVFAFYVAPTSATYALVLGVGMIVFTFMLFSLGLHMEFELIKDIRAKDVYKELAYTDVQTGVKSRTSFDECCDNVGANHIKYVDMVILDINNLKWTNDNLGHIAGDQLIAGAAKCILTAFEGVGECYRIGGDEFAVIAFDSSDKIDGALAKLEDLMMEFNKDRSDIQLSISYGFAGESYKNSELFMEKLFTRADKEMYESKKKWHRLHDN